MIASAVARQPAGRLGFFVAVRRSTSGDGTESASSTCLAFHSSQEWISHHDPGWAEAFLPFCFPLGKAVTGKGKQEPFHFMPCDGSGTHGFCRQISMPHRTQDYIACLVAPWPWFQAFHHATDILALLLSPTLQSPSGATATLAASSQAHTFLTSLHAAIASHPSPGAILQIPLPPRQDYPFAPLHPIAISAPHPSKATTPRLLRTGADFTEVQVPPQPVSLAPVDPSRIVAPLAALVHCLPADALATLVAALITEHSCVLFARSPARAATAAAAAATLTAPLQWRSTLLPLVPPGKLHLLAEPQPVIAGVAAALRGAKGLPAAQGRLEIDLDTGSARPPINSADCCSRLLPGWRQLCVEFEALKATTTSPDDYTFNEAITTAMHGFLAATIGTYRDHIKPPPAAGLDRQPGKSSFSKGLLRALSAPIRFASDVSGRLRSSRTAVLPAGSGAASPPPTAMFMPEDNIIFGEAGWRFHHDQFAATQETPEARALADLLIKTKLWTKFIQGRIVLMQLPCRAGLTDAFELRVLTYLSTQHGRSTRASTQLALPTRSLHGPRLRIGGSFASYGGRADFDPYDPFEIAEEDEIDEDEEMPPSAAVTAALRPRGATAKLAGGATVNLYGGSAEPIGMGGNERAAPPLPPSAAVHPVPAGDAGGAAVGAVTGGGGLSKSANGSLQNMHSALGSSGCMPDC